MTVIGEGQGIAGKFLGLPEEYTTLSAAKIVIVPVPFDETSTYQKGSNFGPKALIEASRNLELYDIETDSEVYKQGICTRDPILEDTSEEMLSKLYNEVQSLLKQGKFVVIVGGEHSISYGAIKAHAEKFSPISLLHLDAHTDLRETYEGDPWNHACIIYHAKQLPGVSHIVSVGIRSMSLEEKKNIDDRISVFYEHNIYDNDAWMNKALDLLSKNVYLTLDLDVLDPSQLPSTGTPEPGGMGWYTVLKFLRKVIEKRNVVGFDVVELCPNPKEKSSDFLAAKLIYKLLSYKFGDQT